MDGDRHGRADEHGGVDGGRRVESSGTSRWTPAPDRQERDIDTTGEPSHSRVEVGVTREIHARRTLDQVPGWFRIRLTRPSRMTSRDSGYPDSPDIDALVARHFSNRSSIRAHMRRKTSWHDDQRLARDLANGCLVEVIRVRVRDEDAVDRPDPDGVRRRAESAQWPESRAQQWVGQEAHPIEFDEQRRMADIRQPQARSHGNVEATAHHEVRAARASHSGSDPTVHAALESA